MAGRFRTSRRSCDHAAPSSGGIRCACGGFGPWVSSFDRYTGGYDVACIETSAIRDRNIRIFAKAVLDMVCLAPPNPTRNRRRAGHRPPRLTGFGIRRPGRCVRALVRPRNPAERDFPIASTSGAGQSSLHPHRPRIRYALVWNPADSFAARYREIAADLVAADPPHTHPVLPRGQRVRQRRTAPRPIRRPQDLVTAVYDVFPLRLRRWAVVRRSVRATT